VFGALFKPDNGQFLLSAESASLVFVGKATWLSTTIASSRPGYGLQRHFYRQSGALKSEDSTISSPNGVYTLRVTDSCGNSSTVTATMPDDVGYMEFSISCAEKPFVFIDGAASIHAISSSGGIWVIRAYGKHTPLPTLYCFSTPVTASGNGMALYDSAGSLTYSTDYKPIVIKDFASVNSVSINAAQTGFDSDTTCNTDILDSLSKPAFLAVDWLRTDFVSNQRSRRIDVYSSSLGCVYYFSCPYALMKITQRFAGAGFKYNTATKVVDINVAGYENHSATINSCDGTATSSMFQNLQKAPLPLLIPIIDGAMYD